MIIQAKWHSSDVTQDYTGSVFMYISSFWQKISGFKVSKAAERSQSRTPVTKSDSDSGQFNNWVLIENLTQFTVLN